MAYLGRQPNTGVRSRYIYTATASQTTFSGSDDDGKTLKYEDAAYLDVFLNGVLLKPVTDYAATTKTSVVLTSGAAVSDIVEIVAYDIANIADTVSKANGGTFDAGVTVNGTVTSDGLTVDTDTLYVDAANNRVGVGTASPESKVHIYESDVRAPAADADDLVIEKTGDTGLSILSTTTGRIYFGDAARDDQGSIRYVHSDDSMRFETDSAEAFRVDSSRNILVGKTATASVASDVPGHTLYAGGTARHIVSGGEVMNIIRQTSDGNIIGIYKGGTHVAAIGVLFNDNPYFAGAQSGHAGITFEGAEIVPMSAVNRTDNYVDIGNSTYRYDDIYATNGTIQTSDANEKQQIASLTDAEITAAKAISKLFKTFKWNDKVEAKGDAARTHTGVIAQDVEQAMTDAGLDAGNYAFFISTTWWEADETYTDDDGVEQTRTNTYKTIEEAPEGATERTRLGIRYPELLSFIGAATEQRLTSIEARLATLENA